jgi:hypothetical protein
LDGALMGMLRFEEILPLKLEEMARTPKKRRRKKRKQSLPVWDTRNVAAATTTPERLEPDPARACPAPTLESESIVKASAAEL